MIAHNNYGKAGSYDGCTYKRFDAARGPGIDIYRKDGTRIARMAMTVEEWEALGAALSPVPRLPKLKIKPPVLSDPQTVVLSQGTTQLDPAKDYVLTQNGPLAGGLKVLGGRNIVWQGGHVRIDHVPYSGDAKAWQRARLGPSFEGFTGHCFIEGYLQDGIDGTEGIVALRGSDTCRFSLQAAHFAAITSRAVQRWDGTKMVPLSPIATGPYDNLPRLASGPFFDNHADAFQTWSAPARIDLDLVTVSTCCQFAFLENPSPAGSSFVATRTNIRPFVLDGREYLNPACVSNAGMQIMAVDDFHLQPPAGQPLSRYLTTYSGDGSWMTTVKPGPVPDFCPASLTGPGYTPPGYL